MRVGIFAFLGIPALVPSQIAAAAQGKATTPQRPHLLSIQVFRNRMQKFEELIAEHHKKYLEESKKQFDESKRQFAIKEKDLKGLLEKASKIHGLINNAANKYHIKHHDQATIILELLPSPEIGDYMLTSKDFIYNALKTAAWPEKSLRDGLDKILEEDGQFQLNSYQNDRWMLHRRFQYRTAIDRYMGILSANKADKRFDAIRNLLSEIKSTSDMKGIAELQARINLLLGIIQNENTKVQLISHYRNADKAFNDLYKHKVQMAVFGHTNRDMPSIKSVAKKF